MEGERPLDDPGRARRGDARRGEGGLAAAEDLAGGVQDVGLPGSGAVASGTVLSGGMQNVFSSNTAIRPSVLCSIASRSTLPRYLRHAFEVSLPIDAMLICLRLSCKMSVAF